MKKLVLLLLSSFLIGNLSGKTPIDKFKAANALYENNDYKAARSAYDSLLSSGYFSADLHYNLGNAYFKLDNIPKAILHYEKALKIQPNLEDAAYNLEIANSRTVDKIESIPNLFFYRWWQSIYNLLSVNGWTTLLFIFLIFAIIGFAFYFLSYRKRIRKIAFYTTVLTVLLGLISWTMAATQNKNLNTRRHAIIIEPTVNINSSPAAGSSKLFVLHQGTKVKIEDRKDDWVNVSIPNGNKGWIKSELIEGI